MKSFNGRVIRPIAMIKADIEDFESRLKALGKNTFTEEAEWFKDELDYLADELLFSTAHQD